MPTMPRKRRKKIMLSILVSLLVIAVLGYFFRYSIAFRFQYARLHSLECKSATGTKEDCLQRLWAHRVNSLERYDWLEAKFKGFETDIFFNDSTHSFSVYHPPLPPPADTLSLVRYLSHVDLQSKRFWLDTRNVNAGNAQAAMDALEATGRMTELKKASIIELYDLGAAEQFAKQGYVVSLDMDAVWPKRMEQEPAYRDSVNNCLRQVPYVSQESSQLTLLKKIFPGKKMIIWHLYFKDYFRLNRIQKLIDDPQVDIILMNIKSPYFR
jgi:hypothetical protein